MFFPSSGGRSTKASSFCGACPVVRMCLREAIATKQVGFWAGTTEGERVVMAEYMNIKQEPVNINKIVFDKEPTAPLKVHTKTYDTVDYLYAIDAPSFT